ncbi:MAG: hypothetical protein INF50_10180 [Rhodobacter sp.]|nr:hypothetical protein [Rhodobacter sp.]
MLTRLEQAPETGKSVQNRRLEPGFLAFWGRNRNDFRQRAGTKSFFSSLLEQVRSSVLSVCGVKMNMPVENLKARRKRIAIAVVLAGLIMPVLIMSSCSGWNTRTMQVESCWIDVTLWKVTADAIFAFVFVAPFMLFIPIVIYIAVLVAFGALVARVIVREATSQELCPKVGDGLIRRLCFCA